MDLKCAGIVSNPNKDKNLDAAKLVAVSLRRQGVHVMFDADAMPEGESDVIDFEATDCIFVLGGDGTLLKAAAKASAYGVPMLGVNMGRLGFLTEIETGEIDSAISRIIKGDYYIEKRLMLECSIKRGDEEIFRENAVNDIAVFKKDIARTICLELTISGVVADDMQCDGMLVSTPTGSTAYSLSAGGPVISPKLDCMLATPVCAHSLHSRAIVVSADDVIKITPLEGGAVLISDGVVKSDIAGAEAVLIKRAQCKAGFIRFKDNYFFSRLKSKFLIWDR